MRVQAGGGHQQPRGQGARALGSGLLPRWGDSRAGRVSATEPRVAAQATALLPPMTFLLLFFPFQHILSLDSFKQLVLPLTAVAG